MFIFVLAQKEPTKSPGQLTVREIRDLTDDLRMLVTSVPKGLKGRRFTGHISKQCACTLVSFFCAECQPKHLRRLVFLFRAIGDSESCIIEYAVESLKLYAYTSTITNGTSYNSQL